MVNKYMPAEQAEASSPYASNNPAPARTASEATAIAGAAVGFRGTYGGSKGQAAQDYQTLLNQQAQAKADAAAKQAASRQNAIQATQQQQAQQQQQAGYVQQAMLDAANRPGYTNPSNLGDSRTQAVAKAADMMRLMGFDVASADEMIGRTLETQRQDAVASGNLNAAGYFLNEEQKWAQNKVEASSAYHNIGMVAGVPIPANPLENAGDNALIFLKGGNPKDNFPKNYAFNPSTAGMIATLPNGQGVQEFAWNGAVARDKNQSAPTPVNFMQSVNFLNSQAGKQGAYGNLRGGIPDAVTPAIVKTVPQSSSEAMAKRPFLSIAANNPAAQQGGTPFVFPDVIASLAGIFGGNKSTTNNPQTSVSVSGSNQTIQDKRAWLEQTKPVLAGMNADINSLAFGNTSGTNWTGSPEGYADITSKIGKYNALNDAFRTNVTQYNAMDAQNPKIVTTTILGNSTAPAPAVPQSDMFQNAMSFLGNVGIPQTPVQSGAVKADADAGSWVQGKIKGLLGGAGIVGSTAYGYGSAGAFGSELGLGETLMSNPIGAGILGGGIVVFGLEASGRLGLTGETKEYSVRTAGRDFQGWLNQQNANQPKTGWMYNTNSELYRGKNAAAPAVSSVMSVDTRAPAASASPILMSIGTPEPMSSFGADITTPTFTLSGASAVDTQPPEISSYIASLGGIIPSPVPTTSTETPTEHQPIITPITPVYTPRVSPFSNFGGTNLQSTLVGKTSLGTDISNIDLTAVNLNRDVIPAGTGLYFLGNLAGNKQLWTTSPEVAMANGGTIRKYTPQQYLRGYLIGGENSQVILPSRNLLNFGSPSTISQQPMLMPIAFELQADAQVKAAASSGDTGMMSMDMSGYDMSGLGFQQMMDVPAPAPLRTGLLPQTGKSSSAGLFNGKLSPLLMGAGEGMYSGSEVPSKSKYSEISPFKSAYSERPNYAQPSEVPAQKRSIIEIFDNGKPWENSNRNRNRNRNANNNENMAENVNEFIDQFGVTYPNPTKNPTGNPNPDIYSNPFRNPFETPNKNQNKLTLQNPQANLFGNPFNPANGYDYNYETPRPENPPSDNWKIPDGIILPNFGFGGLGGGGEGGNGRGMRAFREHSRTWTPEEMGKSLFTGRLYPARTPAVSKGNSIFTNLAKSKPASRIPVRAQPSQRLALNFAALAGSSRAKAPVKAQPRPATAPKQVRAPQLNFSAITGRKQAPMTRSAARTQPRNAPNFTAIGGLNLFAKKKGKR